MQKFNDSMSMHVSMKDYMKARAAHYVSECDKLTKQNAELIKAIESTSRELHIAIEEVNYHRMGKVNCLTESPPDLWDMETLDVNQTLIAKTKGEL